MNQINLFKSLQYFMVIAFILELYDAAISHEQFQTILFLTFSILSLASFFLLKNKVEGLKLKLLKKIPD
jgi:hypothetical protein